MNKLPIGAEQMKALSSALRRVDFFADLSMRDLELVFAVTNLYAYRSGTVIFRKDQLGDALYLVHRGSVDILLPRFLLPARRVARLGPGDVFGEMALLHQPLRTATAVARGPVELFVLLKPDFNQIRNQNPAFAEALERVASKRAFETKDRFAP